MEITPFGCKIEHYYNGKEFENAGQTVSEIITIDKTQSRSSENQVTGKLGLNASLSTHSIDAAAGISAEAKRADETEVKSAIEIRREIGSWHFVGMDIIQLRGIRRDDYKQHLDGPVINSAKAWRVRPNSPEKPCYLLARIRVREPWIELREVQVREPLDGKLTKAMKSLKSLLTSNDKTAIRNRELFEYLLRSLILKQLQDPTEQRHATLCADGLMVLPYEGLLEKIPSTRRKLHLAVGGSVMRQFLSGNDHQKVKIVKKIIDPEISKEFDERSFSRRLLFTDGSFADGKLVDWQNKLNLPFDQYDHNYEYGNIGNITAGFLADALKRELNISIIDGTESRKTDLAKSALLGNRRFKVGEDKLREAIDEAIGVKSLATGEQALPSRLKQTISQSALDISQIYPENRNKGRERFNKTRRG